MHYGEIISFQSPATFSISWIVLLIGKSTWHFCTRIAMISAFVIDTDNETICCNHVDDKLDHLLRCMWGQSQFLIKKYDPVKSTWGWEDSIQISFDVFKNTHLSWVIFTYQPILFIWEMCTANILLFNSVWHRQCHDTRMSVANKRIKRTAFQKYWCNYIYTFLM